MRIKLFMLLTALTLAILGLTVACGDDDDGDEDNEGEGALTVQQYADEFSDIGLTAKSDAQGLSDDLEPQESLTATADIFDDAAEEFDELNAPTELNHVHGPFVDATYELADAFRALADSAGSDSEAEAGDALDTAMAAWQSACQGVVVAVEALDATVDAEVDADCTIGG